MDDHQPPTRMTSAVEIITPEIAVQMLDMNHHNRPVRKSAVQKLAGIIRRGEWSLSHQGIAIDQSGRLLDGQHRLMAIVETGISCELLVTRNAPTSSFQVMDRKTMVGMASAALLVAQMGGNIPVRIGPPPRWTAANDVRKPPSGKDRSKVKAARKQRNRK